ncbi:MAG TPA: hypothetical protein VII09_11265, partial [Opitutaceae bacterium]
MHLSLNRRKIPAKPTSLLLPGTCAVLAAVLLLPASGLACACGCGIYEVGTSSMLPTGSGATAFVDYAYQDQDQNWNGSSRAPASDNPDKDIRTSFLTLGCQDMFNRRWGLRLELPYESRHFETTGGATGSDIVDLNYRGFGDVRIEGIYTGLLPDVSAGLTFGLKLPTGSFTHNDAFGDIDRDTELGSGSTDVLLGGYKRFNLGADYGWSGFAQAVLDVPVLTQAQYRPGAEISAAAGLYSNGWSFGRMLISPIGQVKVSVRGRDSGAAASSPVASGYERVLLAPGVEFDAHPVKVYADV